jgi:hypothetical protein
VKHRTRRLVLAAGLLACAAREAAAQAAEQGESWRFAFTPYAWISGIRGTIGVGSSTGEVDVAFNEGGEDFEFGFAGLIEARRRRWVARTDFFYVSFSNEQATSAGTPVTTGQDDVMLHPEIGYTLLARPWGGVDGLVGARYLNTGLDLSGPSTEASVDRGWVDGTVGANVRYQPGSRWRLVAKADVGAGGSDFVWQLYGGGGYDLGRCCAIVAAWRLLDLDYDKDNLLYDVRLSGPTFGVTLRF